MSAWTHDVHLVCRPWRLLAGHLPLRCSMEGRRQVISGPMRQVEEIFRSTALLNPALAPSHPHISSCCSQRRASAWQVKRVRGRRRDRALEVPGTCAICASVDIAGALHTQCLHGTPVQLQPLSGQCMGGVQHACFASACTFTTFDRAPVACRIVARIVLACPVCCNIIACACR
jgi:hypothetical protein